MVTELFVRRFPFALLCDVTLVSDAATKEEIVIGVRNIPTT